MPNAVNLPQTRIASPCPAEWSQMDGDGAARFCHQCQKHVYDLTVLKLEEIEQLIRKTEGQFCGRLYQRPDGRALSDDCPVGAARVRRRLLGTSMRAAAVVCLVFGGYGYVQARSLVNDTGYGLFLDHPTLSTFVRWTNGQRMLAGVVTCSRPRSNREADAAP